MIAKQAKDVSEKNVLEKTYREREHRFSSLPIKDIMKTRIKDLGLKNRDVQEALGYPYQNVIAMIKSGNMRLSPEKALLAAGVLQLDPAFLLSKALEESNAPLWDAINKTMGNYLVTENEMALLSLVRKLLDGHDIDLTESEDFLQTISPILKKFASRAKSTTTASIKRIDEEKN
jgi:hypothetical protein